MRGNWIWRVRATLISAGLVLSMIGGRGSNAMLLTGVLLVLGGILSFFAEEAAKGLAELAQKIEDCFEDIFPQIRRWSWPLALVTALACFSGVAVFVGWRQDRAAQVEHASLGDIKWLQDLANQSAKQP